MAEDTGVATEAVEQPGAAVDHSALLDAMSDQLSSFGEQFEARMVERFQPAEPVEEPADPWESLYGEPEGEPAQPAFDPRQFAQQIAQASNQTIEQRLNELMQPHLAEMAQVRAQLSAQDLEARYPELKDPEVVGAAGAAAQEWAARMGRPELAAHPSMVEAAYLLSKVKDAAQSEVPADGGHDVLELPGGAPRGQEPDVADLIVNAGGGGLRGLFG